MQAIELEAEVDHQHRLNMVLPKSVPAGMTKVIIMYEPVSVADSVVDEMETRAFSNHSANLVEDWLHPQEQEYGIEWPESVKNLAGAWRDFPALEEIRGIQKQDTPRETL